MWESFVNMTNSGEIWVYVFRVLLGLVLSGVATLIGTLIATIISKHKESKIYKYASTLVDAAEQKYPNEGTKMGPQKLDYVMGQLMIKFPKIRDNRYLYNIVEQAVFKLNDDRQKQKLIEEFESRHGVGSYICDEDNASNQPSEVVDDSSMSVEDVVSEEQEVSETQNTIDEQTQSTIEVVSGDSTSTIEQVEYVSQNKPNKLRSF